MLRSSFQATAVAVLITICAQVGFAAEYTIRVEEPLRGPVPGVEVGAVTSQQCLLPVRTDTNGIAVIRSDYPLAGVIVVDPKKRFAPTSIQINYSAEEYVVPLSRERMNRKSAEEKLNDIMEILAAAGELTDLGSKIASGAGGTVIGVPGVFSLVPQVRDGEIYFEATGVVADFLAAYLPSFTGTPYGNVSM